MDFLIKAYFWVIPDLPRTHCKVSVEFWLHFPIEQLLIKLLFILTPEGLYVAVFQQWAKVYSLFSPWQGIIKKANLLSMVRTIGYPTWSSKSNCPFWNLVISFCILMLARNKVCWIYPKRVSSLDHKGEVVYGYFLVSRIRNEYWSYWKDIPDILL